MAEKEYTQLTPPRRQAGFAVVSVTRSNLWLGKDHLLSVETEGYTERYKRFYFRDIQAVIVRKTNRALIIGVVTGTLTALFVIFTVVSNAIEAKWVLGILAAVCALPFVVNLIYGPTCFCQLRTAVQTEDLPSLSRVRRARKVLQRVRPLIAEAQGQIAAEEIPTRLQTMLATAAPAGIATPGTAPPVVEAAGAPPQSGG
jgi:hypothetical protein